MEPSAPKLYPELTSPEIITEEQLNLLINESKQRDRVRYMKDKQNDLKLKLKHYVKVKRYWSLARRILEGIGITTMAALGISSIVLTAGVLTIPLVPAILTGGSITVVGILTTLDKSLLKRRETHLKKKQLNIKETLDKMHFYFEKCRDDNVITLEEIEAFDKILKPSIPQNSDSFLEEITQVIKSMSKSQIRDLQKSI